MTYTSALFPLPLKRLYITLGTAICLLFSTIPGCLADTPIRPATQPTAVCSLTVSTYQSSCLPATNTYSTTAVVALTDPIAGILTIANGPSSLTFATTPVTSATYIAVFNSLVSDGDFHDITATLPGCDTQIATYTAPASCASTPTCSLSVSATPTACNAGNNRYSLSGTITLTSSPTAQTITFTDASYTHSLTAAAGTTSITYSYSNVLTSNGLPHTVSVVSSLSTCGQTSATYTAPASCSTTPVCSISPAVTVGTCAIATNTYSSTVTVNLTNPTAGVLLVTDGPASVSFVVPTVVGIVTASAVFTGLISNGTTHTITATLPGCGSQSVVYTAPNSCTTVSTLALLITPSSCNSATNQYTLSGTLSLTNAGNGLATFSDGTSTYSVSITTGQTSATFTFAGLNSGTGAHTVLAQFTGQTLSQTYTAPANCTMAPSCTLVATATPGSCNTAVSQYTLTGTVTATNGPASQTLTISAGSSTTTVVITGNSPVSYTLTGLPSDGVSHTVTVSSNALTCSTTSTTYRAPTCNCPTEKCVPVEVEKLR